MEKKLIMLPGPTNVPERVVNAMTKPIINHRSAEFHALYAEIEENLKYVFKTGNDVFVLTASGTGGVECAVSNLINPGEKAIVPVFGTFSRRLAEKIRRRGGTPIELSIPLGTVPKAKYIKEILENEQDATTAFIVCNETSTGVTVRELSEIGRITKENGMLLAVDAVSILGGDELPVDDWNIDVCVTGSQKCLACPPGLALISVSEKAWEKIERTKNRPMYFDLLRMKESAAKNETPFTPAIPLFYALNEALKMVREEGLTERFKRHKLCAEAFYTALESFQMTVFPREVENRSNTVIAVNVPETLNGGKVREIMRNKYQVLIADGMDELKGKIFRIGCMGTVSQTETLTTLNALGKALKEAGFNVEIEKALETARKVFNKTKTINQVTHASLN
ncbi:MAG: alanine--glyoxylate aminotransferase family protein [Candidatus Bathyarchaeia archaeon]